jgi:hypothetical protein
MVARVWARTEIELKVSGWRPPPGVSGTGVIRQLDRRWKPLLTVGCESRCTRAEAGLAYPYVWISAAPVLAGYSRL